MAASDTSSPTRRMIRQIAAGLAALVSLIYFLIGLQVLTVLDNPGDQTAFGFIAGSVFLLGALVIYFFDRRWLMAMGCVAQALIIFIYFDLAEQREPGFEVWGILIRVVQALLLVALAYLALSRREPGPRTGSLAPPAGTIETPLAGRRP